MNVVALPHAAQQAVHIALYCLFGLIVLCLAAPAVTEFTVRIRDFARRKPRVVYVLGGTGCPPCDQLPGADGICHHCTPELPAAFPDGLHDALARITGGDSA